MTRAEQKGSDSAVNPGHSQQESKVGPRPHFLISRFAWIQARRDSESADFKIDCAAKLPAQVIITGGGWQSRCGGSEVAQAAARGATGDCQDMPSNASRMSGYTGATSPTYATTSRRAGQRAGGGEGRVA